MLLHMQRTQPLRLVDKRSLLALAQRLPLSPETLRDLRVVHLGVLLSHLTPLAAGPDHEGVHGPLHPVRVVLVVRGHGLGALVVVVVVVHGGRGGGRAAGRAGRQGGAVLGELRLVHGRLVVRGGVRGRGQVRG